MRRSYGFMGPTWTSTGRRPPPTWPQDTEIMISVALSLSGEEGGE